MRADCQGSTREVRMSPVLLGIAALILLSRLVQARDRRTAREDFAPYFNWVRNGRHA